MTKAKPRTTKTVEVRWSSRREVYPHGVEGCWLVVDLGHEWSRHTRKRDAVQQARGVAQDLKAELIVKKKDGRIGYRNSYGNDPRNRKG
jgi:hypothetical protein